MEGKDDRIGRGLLGKGVHFLKRDLVIFAFFLVLSFFFWYLNSLRKDFEVELKYPAKYINNKGGRINAGELPPMVILNLKGPGYSIVKQKLTLSRSPLIVDFSRVALKRVPDTQPAEYCLITSSLIPGFSKQLSSEFQILSVKPDTIFVTFGNRGSSGAPGKGLMSSDEKHKN